MDKNGIIITENDWNKILELSKQNETEKDIKKINEYKFSITYLNTNHDVATVIEWDNVIGNIIRIYIKDERLLKLLEDTWRKTTEELNV